VVVGGRDLNWMRRVRLEYDVNGLSQNPGVSGWYM